MHVWQNEFWNGRMKNQYNVLLNISFFLQFSAYYEINFMVSWKHSLVNMHESGYNCMRVDLEEYRHLL